MHAALVKGFFAEEGLSVQGMMTDVRSAVEQGKPHGLWVKTDQGLTEADFGNLVMNQLHHVAAGKVDYYIVDGLNFGCEEVLVPLDSPLKSTADLKGKTIAIPPNWAAPFFSTQGPWFVHQELKAAGLDPAKEVTMTPIPWDALPKVT